MTDPRTATAEAIGRQILGRSQVEGDGLWWPRTVPPGAEGIVEERTPALWGGDSGIALFLLELYGVTRDPTLLDAARRSLTWCVREAPRVPRERQAGFMNGGMGVPYVLCRAYDITGETGFLEQARSLALQLVAGQKDWSLCDLLTGLSGTVLVLAHLESRDPDPGITHAREELLHELIERSRPHRQGLFWDASPRWALPLCGMAHGPSGIAFVLAELLGQCDTGSDHPLRALIREAFAYEDQYYRDALGNWPDHRSSQSADAEPEFMNAWCHGAAGIGLARLGAADVGLDQSRQLRAAVATTIRDLDTARAPGAPRRSLTLCHGLAGLAEFLLSAGGAEGRQAAERVGDAAVDQFARLGTIVPGYKSPDLADGSLFVGSGGVGLFLLRLEHGSRVPSVLRPSLPPTRPAPPDADWVWEALEEGFFGRTRRLIDSRGLQERGEGSEGPIGAAVTLVEKVQARLSRRSRHLPPADRERVEDVLALESMHVCVSQRVNDYVELCRGWRIPDRREEPGQLQDDALLVVRPGVWFHQTKWDWTSRPVEAEPGSAPHPGGLDVMIVAGVAGSTERPLSPLAARLIRRFRRPARLARVLAELDEEDSRTAREIASAGLGTGLLLQVEDGGA